MKRRVKKLFETQHQKTKVMTSQPHHFIVNRKGKSGSNDGFSYLGYKIKKGNQTNLNKEINSRHITLPIKVYSAMFSIVLYGCDN